MPLPFPGMNPYLEAPFLWREVPNRLIVVLANDLGAVRLRPNYSAAIETRRYLEDGSDGVLVGIQDDIMFASALPRSSAIATVAVELPPAQSQRVQLVAPIEVKERFLEARQVETHAVVTAIAGSDR